MSELGDRLRDGAKTSYGDGAFIVRYPRGFGRNAGFNLINRNRDGHGYRGYSTLAQNKADTKFPKKFMKLAEFCKNNPDNTVPDNLFSLLRNPELYLIAYNKLKSNPGNMTPGIRPQTLDGISMEWIMETIKRISNQTFDFQPGRRVMIPKANGKMRPLTVAPPRDKIIQEVIRMILEIVFEPTFSNNSHGFRPTRSCHSALRQIRTQFGSASFYIEGDISKCFDSFDHHVLMKIIEDKIKDRRFTSLIWKALRAGYFEFHEIKTSITGTPQGSIISPLLANIYLNKFDQFMETKMNEYIRGKVARVNTEYKRLEYKGFKAHRLGNNREALKYMKLKQLIPSRLKADPNFRRMYYVRYADDWIIAIRGPHSDVVTLLTEIKEFLMNTLKLELSSDKTKITKPTAEPALFLGTEISISNHVYSAKGKYSQHVRVPSQIRMLAPQSRIYDKLSAAGLMCKNSGMGTPRFLWKHLDKDAIILMYNSVLSGYLNYYSFTHNYNHLAASLTHILKSSCIKLLAAKYTLKNSNKVIKKFGRDLKGNGKVSFLKPSTKLKPWDFKTNVKEHLSTLYASQLSVAKRANLTCSKCGTGDRIEMHHVRRMSELNPKLSLIDRLMVKARRKQIPLCRVCHLEHHKNYSPWKSSKNRRLQTK